MLTNHEIKKRVDAELKRLYAKTSHEAAKIDPSYGELLEVMGSFILRGGKRLRPYLAYLTYIGFGGTDEDLLIHLGAALELFHNFLLIHDDIIDRDFFRYGGLNIEGAYREKFKKLQSRDGEHAPLVAALLGGDVAANLSRTLLFDLPIAAEITLNLLKAFNEAFFQVGGGEFADSLAGILKDPLTVEQINSIYVAKTAEYSFYLPMQVGVMLAGKKEEHIRQIRTLSIPIGIAFQIRDDYLGLFGNPVQTGKPVLSDLQEGKQTIYYALLREKLTSTEKVAVQKFYGNPKANLKDLAYLQQLLREKGVLSEVENCLQQLVQETKKALKALHFPDDIVTIFTYFIEDLLVRTA